MRKPLLIAIVLGVLTGCSNKESKTPQQEPAAKAEQQAPSDSVVQEKAGGVPASTTMGKVVAERYADLSFETALPIAQVLVKNGQQVRRGQVLAQLDQFKLRNAIAQQQRAIEQAELKIEQARLQMQDVIISQGYDPDKESSIPASVRHHADVKSGYALSKSQLATAKSQLAAAQHELSSGVLTSPFDGVVANVAVQAHQLAQAGQPVCRVIASGNMAVDFRVMEADLSKYKMGTAVTVVPVADKSAHYEATISEINPVVDQQGAITLRARLNGAQGLFDGMNVEVITKIDN
jgi:RND family efflux transporter MFP subunit